MTVIDTLIIPWSVPTLVPLVSWFQWSTMADSQDCRTPKMVEFPLKKLKVPHSFCGPICTSQFDHTNHCFTSLVPIEPYTLVCIGGDLRPIVAIPKLGSFTRSPTQPSAPSAKGSINACRIALPGSACGATLCDQKMMPLLYVQPLQPLCKKNNDET